MKQNKLTDLHFRCIAVIRNARAQLGFNLGGGSIVDLVLDNIPQIKNTAEAEKYLTEAGEM